MASFFSADIGGGRDGEWGVGGGEPILSPSCRPQAPACKTRPEKDGVIHPIFSVRQEISLFKQTFQRSHPAGQ